MSLADRFAVATGLDCEWERPAPSPVERRADVVVAVALLADTALSLELVRSSVAFTNGKPVWAEYLAILALMVPLAVRRSHPLAVAVYAAAHMIVIGIWIPETTYQVPMQIAYFLAYFTALAWGRSRRAAVGVTLLIIGAMAAWMTLSFAVGSGIDEIRSALAKEPGTPDGLLPPVTAQILLSIMTNLLYFGGAVAWGLSAWHAARNKVVIAEQAARLEGQAAELRDQAVVEERLRIARELHDVVAHHVSVMGVQAGAARRVLDKDPALAATALGAVESSSRQAVSEMRALLGTLRGTPVAEPPAAGREPQPTLGELPALVEQYAEAGFEPTYSLVEASPGAAAAVPMPIALTLFRTAQEALTNTRKHSSARTASVTLRVEPEHAEVEIVDDGRPLGGTSGTGLGLLGMRERIAALDGQVDIGPRLTGGYRVRVRLPLPGPSSAVPAGVDAVPAPAGAPAASR